MKEIVALILFLIASAIVSAKPQGSILEVSFVSSDSSSVVPFSIYFPPDYYKSDNAYPVLYHLHSLGGSYQSESREFVAETYEQAVEFGFVEPMIIVFPDGFENSMWADSRNGKKPAETNFIRELVPFVDARYRTIPDREHRLLEGFSMGGFGAVKFLVKYPEMFCRAASYDGGMRTWSSLSKDRPAIAAENFESDSVYFYENTLWKPLRENSHLLMLDTSLLLAVGDFVKMNNTLFDSLGLFGVPFKAVQTPCGHNINCLMDRLWISSSDFFSSCTKLPSELSVAHSNMSRISKNPLPNYDYLSINFSVPAGGNTTLDLTDEKGNVLKNIRNEFYFAGNYRLNILKSELTLPGGLYFIQVSNPNSDIIRKMFEKR